MFRFSPLASSSKGNATLISGGGTHLLVDTGISALRLRKGLEECGLSLKNLTGVFFTHEHTDHTTGLGTLAKRTSLHLYCTQYMAQDIRHTAPSALYTYLEPGAGIQVGEIKITPFSVSHDAVDPVGYLFEHGGKKLGYITDTGRTQKHMEDLLSGVDALFLESNYDPHMLHHSGRPYHLIERIEGMWGHLSNEQACDFVRKIAHPGLQHIVLAHLSRDCNTPSLAQAAMQKTLDELGLGTRLHCAPADHRLPWIEIS